MRCLHRSEFDLDDHGPTLLKPKFSDRRSPCCGGHPVPYNLIQNLIAHSVGKPWAETHSKLSARWSHRGNIGGMIWHAINDMVDDNTFIDKGKVWGEVGFWRRPSYWVHPQTGLLECDPGLRIVYPDPPITTIKLSPTTTLLKIEGIWFQETTITKIVKVVDKIQAAHPDAIITYGWRTRKSFVVETGYCFFRHVRTGVERIVTKKQLNHNELRSHNLSNTSTPFIPRSRREIARSNQQS